MSSSLREIVGKRVAQRRHQRRLTHEALAAKSGLHETTLSRVEHGHMSLSMEKLAALVTSLETTADYLLGLSEDPERLQPTPQTRRRTTASVG